MSSWNTPSSTLMWAKATPPVRYGIQAPPSQPIRPRSDPAQSTSTLILPTISGVSGLKSLSNSPLPSPLSQDQPMSPTTP